MQVVITGKQLNIGEALLGHVDNQLADAMSKNFEQAIEASAVFLRQGKGKQVRSDISVHVGRNFQSQSHAGSYEAKAAFDAVLERIAKRLRRHKRRLRDHQIVGQEF
jgi:ribosomal subunit interface protein